MGYTIKPWQDLMIQDDYMSELVMRRKPICKRMLEKIRIYRFFQCCILDIYFSLFGGF